MSRVAKTTLISSIIFTTITVWGVHYLQQWERDRMYQGVIRDEERRREKLRETQLTLSESAAKDEFRKDPIGGDNLKNSNHSHPS